MKGLYMNLNPIDPIAADITSEADVINFPSPMHLITHCGSKDTLGNFGKNEIERSAHSLVAFIARANTPRGIWHTFSLSRHIFYLFSERQQGKVDPDILLHGLFGAWLDTDGHSQVHEFKHSLLVTCPNGRFAVTRYFVECCMAK